MKSGAINTTKTCHCGAAKSAKQQWCQTCWRELPKHCQDSWFDMLEKINKCIRTLDAVIKLK